MSPNQERTRTGFGEAILDELIYQGCKIQMHT
jgi:hypothetical protein